MASLALAVRPGFLMRKAAVVTSCWFVNLCRRRRGFVRPSLVPALTASNLPANFSQAVVCAFAPAHSEQGDVRGPQMREELQSEVAVSQRLRVRRGDTLVGTAVPKTTPHFVGPVLALP